MSTPAPLPEPPDFSLALGGPLYRMLRRFDPGGTVPQWLLRQAVVAVLLCWIPLAVLSLAQGHFWGELRLSFLRDIETHVRFLVSLPVLILAEMAVHQRIRPIMKRFVERRVVIAEDVPRYYATIETGVRIHNSVILDLVLLVFVSSGGMWIWRHQIVLGISSWYASSQGGQIHLTMAGNWLAFVSVPIFQFILLRWYMQILFWLWFLFRVSRFNLHLNPLHPDRAGGISFIGTSSLAFAPLLFAHSALLSGQIASRILYNSGSLFASELTIGGYVVCSVAAALSPLSWFTPQLLNAKRRGLARYGNFASEYVRDFDEKWLEGKVNDKPLGSGDIQSLADLGNSFAVVRDMRLVPFSTDDLVLLVLATVAPFLPLLLTIMPPNQLVIRIIKIIF